MIKPEEEEKKDEISKFLAAEKGEQPAVSINQIKYKVNVVETPMPFHPKPDALVSWL